MAEDQIFKLLKLLNFNSRIFIILIVLMSPLTLHAKIETKELFYSETKGQLEKDDVRILKLKDRGGTYSIDHDPQLALKVEDAETRLEVLHDTLEMMRKSDQKTLMRLEKEIDLKLSELNSDIWDLEYKSHR
jgi:hypothetical protein